MRLPFLSSLSLVLLVAACSLSGCNGTVVVGGVGGDGFDTRPTVSMAASNRAVTQAGTTTLVAAASDDSQVRDVAFYSLVDNLSTQIGRVTSEPYRISLDFDRSSNGTHYYFARATDDTGNTSDSGVVTVTVTIP
ncbi:hypothetical protein BH10PSE17_BH10PSE17_25760 [soil metagenome]